MATFMDCALKLDLAVPSKTACNERLCRHPTSSWFELHIQFGLSLANTDDVLVVW